MGVLEKVLFVLVFELTILCTGSPLSSGAADVYPIHPKYEQSDFSSLIEQDTHRIGRRLQAATKSTFFSMQGSVYPDGIYYTTVYFGNPPKPYFLDVDTGSDLTWLQCDAPCQSCAKTPHQLYKPPMGSLMSCKDPLCAVVQAASQEKYDCKSSSQQCDYDIKYADRDSSRGVIVRDNVLVKLTNGTLIRANSVFGCGYDQFGSLAVSPATTDGVLGLSSGTASFTSQWAKQGLIKNVIGLCIAGGGKKGGYMFFGDDHVPTSSMTWVPMLGKPSMKYYNAGAAQMIVGNKLLAKDGNKKMLGGIVFDTGSSYTYFTKEAYVSLISAVREAIGKQLVQDSSDRTLPLCWRGKKTFRSIADATSYFKTLTFNFRSNSPYTKNAKLEIPPEGYLIISAKGNVCLGILDGTGISSFNILGDISLQGYLVVYDNSNQRIGWTRTDCTKLPKSVQRRWVLEDPPQLHGGETTPCAQDLGKAVCPSSSYFLPDFGVLQQTSSKTPNKGHK